MGINKNTNITIGSLKKGVKNLITDVEGIKVGHVTLDDEHIKTGVTVVLPHENNIFKEKLLAACSVINGFGKSTGLVQVEELGNIETPIVLTNTLSVGTCYNALVKYMLENNDDIGNTTGTANPIIMECNDGYLNDKRGLHVKEDDVFKAIENANTDFEEGSVGAGTGMSCYGLKGGIGSSSRIVELDGYEYTVGSLVLSNFGVKKDLIINHNNIGSEIASKENLDVEKGSIIIIIATDIPLSERSLKRISKRSSVALSRTGSYLGNGSGDICLAFTTANKSDVVDLKMINENKIDLVFRGVVESVEESIVSSMMHSNTTIGRDENERKSINEYLR